jgi:YHS domain-containing protein
MLRIALALAFSLSLGLATTEASACGGCGCSGDKSAEGAPAAPVAKGFDKMPSPGTKAVCPVMGETFTVTKNSPYSEHKGKTYVFCCASCKPKFDKDPAKYLDKKG